MGRKKLSTWEKVKRKTKGLIKKANTATKKSVTINKQRRDAREKKMDFKLENVQEVPKRMGLLSEDETKLKAAFVALTTGTKVKSTNPNPGGSKEADAWYKAAMKTAARVERHLAEQGI